MLHDIESHRVVIKFANRQPQQQRSDEKSQKKLHSLATTFIGYTRKKESAPVIIISSVRQRALREFKLYFAGVKKNFNGKRREVKRVIYSHFFASFLAHAMRASVDTAADDGEQHNAMKTKGRELRIATKKSSRCCCTCLPVQPFCCSFNSSLHSSLVDSARYIRRPTGKLWSFDCDFCVAAALARCSSSFQ